MKIRMKYKYYHGFTKQNQNLLDIDPVLPQCENYGNRLELKEGFYNPAGTEEYKKPPENKEEYEEWKAERFGKGPNAKSEYNKAWGEYSKAWWASRRSIPKKEKRDSPPDLIKMELNHGDMVVMHGQKLQQYFEVRVPILIVLCLC